MAIKINEVYSHLGTDIEWEKMSCEHVPHEECSSETKPLFIQNKKAFEEIMRYMETSGFRTLIHAAMHDITRVACENHIELLSTEEEITLFIENDKLVQAKVRELEKDGKKCQTLH